MICLLMVQREPWTAGLPVVYYCVALLPCVFLVCLLSDQTCKAPAPEVRIVLLLRGDRLAGHLRACVLKTQASASELVAARLATTRRPDDHQLPSRSPLAFSSMA